jgi:hypothetical protein
MFNLIVYNKGINWNVTKLNNCTILVGHLQASSMILLGGLKLGVCDITVKIPPPYLGVPFRPQLE